MAPERKTTIMDIARLTGLSKGTVDRVLHNRGEVSKKSREKVMEAVRELGYEPDLNASILARREVHTIALLVPSDEKGSFWELALSSLDKVRENLLPMRIHIRHFSYDQYSEESFRDACYSMLESRPSAVVIAPMFRAGTLTLVGVLQQRGIPYAFIDSKLEIDGYTAYYGMPLYKSGYLCADLLTGGKEISDVLIVRVHRDKERQSDPTVNRRAGFMDYMLQNCPACTIHSRFIDPADPDASLATLEAFFGEHPQVRHIVMFNSRVHLLLPYLRSHPDRERRVIGFDNLEANLQALRHGYITILIGQHPDEQVGLAIQAMADLIVFGRQPVRRDNFMHMDILTKYNIEDY